VTDRRALLVTGADLAPQALELLKDFEVVYAGKTPQEDDLVALCRRHDPVAIVVRYGKVGAAVMDAAPSLRVISKHGSGTDTIDQDAAKARGIEVRAAAGANAAAVAEHALALLLACAKSVVQLNARMHARHWDKATHKSVELHGRTIGLVGLGAIGQRFARMCDAMRRTVPEPGSTACRTSLTRTSGVSPRSTAPWRASCMAWCRAGCAASRWRPTTRRWSTSSRWPKAAAATRTTWPSATPPATTSGTPTPPPEGGQGASAGLT
jgi:hypothetical protein